MNFKKGLAGAFVAASLLLPLVTQAATLTSDQVNAVVNLLQSFNANSDTISQVQKILTYQPSPTAAGMPPGQVGKSLCITLNRNLGVGSQGDDVKNLQQLLSQDPNTGF